MNNTETQLYNDEGQVRDSDIAHEMAKIEAPYHEKSFFGLVKPSEAKLKEGDAAAEKVGETLNEIKKRALAELPYHKEVLFAEIHGFPKLSDEDAELVVNGPMRRYLSSILEKQLTEKGASVDMLSDKNGKVKDDKVLGLRIFQNYEDASYGSDYQRNTFSYQKSKIQIYFTRNAFEY